MNSDIFHRTLADFANKVVEGKFEVVHPDGCTDVEALRKRLAESREQNCNAHEHTRKMLKKMIPSAVPKKFPGI